MDRIEALLARLATYSWPEVLVELGLIWIVVFALVRFLQGTRAAGAVKGLLLVLAVATAAVRVLGGGESFERLAYLYDRVLALVAIGLVVIFQPELRRLLIRLGEARLFRASPGDVAARVDEISVACAYLSKARFGAIIAMERTGGLRGLTEGGTPMDAELSSRLLQTIFFPGSALHDLAVVVRGQRVVAAGVQLPLADPEDMPDPSLGSRHRAAVGLTKESDALVVVVSEETGAIRISESGRLSRSYAGDELAGELRSRLGVGREAAAAKDEADKSDGLAQEEGLSDEGTRESNG
ncbi:MAG: diadenylate cyclase CdaA [Planctomycetota bacterium]